jgi:dCTP deaminase
MLVDLSAEADGDALYRPEDIENSPLVLRPGEFVLGATVESVKVHPSLACRLDGRSTLARLGLMIHCTADTIDNNHGEHRAIVLELKNIGDFTVKIPYMYGIGMLAFLNVSAPVDPSEEQDQYAGQIGVAGPNLRFRAPYFGADV